MKKLVLLLTVLVNVMPTQPLAAAVLAPNPYTGPGTTPAPICTVELESLSEIACLCGIIALAHLVRYLYLKNRVLPTQEYHYPDIKREGNATKKASEVTLKPYN